MNMNSPQQELWQRLENHELDDPAASFPLSVRLAAENAWSLAFTRRAVAEYRRFAFLAVAAGHPVSPPDSVDQVWHLPCCIPAIIGTAFVRWYWVSHCIMGRRGVVRVKSRNFLIGMLALWKAIAFSSVSRPLICGRPIRVIRELCGWRWTVTGFCHGHNFNCGGKIPFVCCAAWSVPGHWRSNRRPASITWRDYW